MTDWHDAAWLALTAAVTAVETDAVRHGGKTSDGTLTHACRTLIGPRYRARWCVATGLWVWLGLHMLLGVKA